MRDQRPRRPPHPRVLPAYCEYISDRMLVSITLQRASVRNVLSFLHAFIGLGNTVVGVDPVLLRIVILWTSSLNYSRAESLGVNAFKTQKPLESEWNEITNRVIIYQLLCVRKSIPRDGRAMVSGWGCGMSKITTQAPVACSTHAGIYLTGRNCQALGTCQSVTQDASVSHVHTEGQVLPHWSRSRGFAPTRAVRQ